MNILVSGADGFIGKHLCAHLRKEHELFAVLSDSDASNTPVDMGTLAVDLSNRVRAKTLISDFKKDRMIDVIIHMAFNLASKKNLNDINALHDNIKISETVVEMLRILKPKKLINFSSIAVYPNRDGMYSESSVVNPSINNDCIYGLSKLCAENIFDFALRDSDIAISHLRIAQVYGDGMHQDRIIPTMLQELSEKNAITVFGDGERMSNFIKVDKLVKIIEVFIKKDSKGVYNIGNENISYFELAERLIREYGDEDSRIIRQSQGSRIKFCLNTEKLNCFLNGEDK